MSLAYATSAGRRGTVSGDLTLTLAAGETISFNLAAGGHWFGHGFNHTQPCPLERGSVVNDSFAVNNIQSPVWLCSAGVAILADTRRLLGARLNADDDGTLRVTAAVDAVTLRVWRRDTLPAAQSELLRYLGWPNHAPSAATLGDSLFCTWTQYPRCLTQARIVDMARQIRDRGYPCSTLIVDDRWESCFGELEFAKKDFPDPPAMTREIHALGLKVWLWVTPFVNQEAANFAALSAANILVPAADGGGAALFKWWGGTAGLVDVTAPQGRRWLAEQLRRLRDTYGVDGFKIDGGDFKYQPSPAAAAWHEFVGESGYSDALLAVFEEVCPNACETRTAWLSQRRDIIWRQGGKDSHWGADNGLAATVGLALHLGLLGYDTFIPDMIPGRVQTMRTDFPLPTDELMTRWTEATAFMPLMQFSYFPWNYAPATERALRGLALAHKALQGYLAAQARARRAPLLRPVWYDTPSAAELYTVGDEFLLGDDLLVAPVLTAGAVARDVLLPPGEWTDAWTGVTVSGGWHKNYPAPCPGIPLFVKAGHRELAATLRAALAVIERGSIVSGVTTTTYTAGLNRDLSVTG
ncbi:MAG: glycoside hydrolase family 31 protein [Verrucomicrobiales bacterium]|jgi:alpha-glucosidase (family GH31 glycosyl hydrolase)|nr:glycoside hydrolase family 31 protein [Verrucomicrobiales bacterium]